MSIAAIEHDTASGDVRIVFAAVNSSEHLDAAPVVSGLVARISNSGVLFDGVDAGTVGWEPVTVEAAGVILAPVCQKTSSW